MTDYAIGLIHHPAGTPAADRWWARALVVRHARDKRLRLVDIVDLDDHRVALTMLAHLAATTGASVLVTDGVPPDVAERLAADLGLRHQAVPSRSRPASPS
jgi:hypothetical protein